MLTYSGHLGNEGQVVVDEFLHKGYADRLSEIYESEMMAQMRAKLKGNRMLFFSYAEMEKDEAESFLSSPEEYELEGAWLLVKDYKI